MRLGRPLDRLAALDPTGLVGRRVVDAARLLPGVALGERAAELVGDAMLGELERRIGGMGTRALPPGEQTTRAARGGDGADPAAPPAPRPSPGERLDALLRRSADQRPEEGEQALVEMLIGELVPDEARILVALSDGSAFPVLDVLARGGPDTGRVLLAGVSNVGRLAGVVLPERTPVYLTHMLGLGLVERGEEDPALRAEYEALLDDPAVRDARGSASGLRRPRVLRGTVCISPLGRTVWATSHGA